MQTKAYAEHIATAKLLVERSYRQICRRLPAVEGQMLQWLVKWPPAADHITLDHCNCAQEKRTQPLFIHSMSRTLDNVKREILAMHDLTESSTLSLRDVCYVHHQLATD